jgi:hypothetical protein
MLFMIDLNLLQASLKITKGYITGKYNNGK